MNVFFVTLDKRYQDKVAREGGTVARKVRRIGTPSKSRPPIGAPAWTVNENYTFSDGIIHLFNNIMVIASILITDDDNHIE